MRSIVTLIIALWAAAAHTQVWEDQRFFGTNSAQQQLQIISSTDTDYLAPMMSAFVAQNPNVAIQYSVAGTADIYRIVQEQPAQFDLVISSAMDLQIKLVNDGFATRLDGLSYPEWAQWRQSLFGFTAEPAAIVLNRHVFETLPVPQTRQELIALLRQRPDVFRNRVATYDIRQSGVGYLFATQDARTSETYWRLTEVMGGLGMQLYCCSGEMIDAVSKGEIYLAYNVLGSYARTRAKTDNTIEVIVPNDFSTTMMRTIYLASGSKQKEVAQDFLEFTLEHSLKTPEPSSLLPRLMSNDHEEKRQFIPLEPSLMIYLDRLKRAAFVQEWESAVIQ